MSRIFEALQQANPDLGRSLSEFTDGPQSSSQFSAALIGEAPAMDEARQFSLPMDSESRLVAWMDPHSLAAENLRGLSARLRQAQQRRPLNRVLVTSAVKADGKSTISLNLAITLAAHGEKTLLVDGDLHQHALSATLGLGDEPGLADWCERSEILGNILHRAEGLPLWFLPAGICEEQPLKVLQSSRSAELLKQLGTWFSWIIIDSPPLVPLADGNVWCTLSDAVLLVVKERVTPKRALVTALEALEKSKLFALVMNHATPQEERYYREYRNKALRAAKIAHKSQPATQNPTLVPTANEKSQL